MPPIKPSKVVKKIPEVVFECFNHFITLNFNGNSSTVYQDDVVTWLEGREYSRDEIFNKHWLDVEAHYRKAGWKVEYEKPAYNETGRAYYVFTKKGKN